jgi:long-subunit fatty acid transport protein
MQIALNLQGNDGRTSSHSTEAATAMFLVKSSRSVVKVNAPFGLLPKLITRGGINVIIDMMRMQGRLCRDYRSQWLFFWASVLLMVAFPAAVQGGAFDTIEITSSPNPVGSGARALGMGGAFISVADDATAASWNPAGLIQLEKPEASLVGEGFHRAETNRFSGHPEASGEQTVSQMGLNYLSAAYPFSVAGYSMVASINYQHLYDFARQWQLKLDDKKNSTFMNVDFSASGGLYAYGLAYSILVLPTLSFGFTLNIWQDGIYENGWQQQELMSFRTPYFQAESVMKNSYGFQGFNGNVGLLWNVTDKLNLGAVFKSPFTASLKHKIFDVTTITPIGSPETSRFESEITQDEELDMPMSYGFGASFLITDRVTVSSDVYVTRWDDFALTLPGGRRISPISGKPLRKSNVRSTVQVRTGVEYLYVKPAYTIPFRCGLFYDPAPAENGQDNYYGFSLGSGISLGRFAFDLAYQYRTGNAVGSSLVQQYGFSQDVQEHNVYSSLIVYF